MSTYLRGAIVSFFIVQLSFLIILNLTELNFISVYVIITLRERNHHKHRHYHHQHYHCNLYGPYTWSYSLVLQSSTFFFDNLKYD